MTRSLRMTAPVLHAACASLMISVTPPLCLADSVEGTTAAASGYFSQDLSYDRALSPTVEGSVGYALTRLSNDSSPAESNSEFRASAAWMPVARTTLGAEITYSTSPAASLHSSGAHFFYSRKFSLNTNVADDVEEDFTPTFSLRAGAGIEKYAADMTSASMTTGKRGRMTQISGSMSGISILQRSLDLLAGVSPVDWASLAGSISFYGYNREVSEFLASLDSPQLADQNSSGLDSAVSSFYDQSRSLKISIFPDEDWELELTRSWARYQADGFGVHSTRLLVSRYFSERFNAGLGLASTASSSRQNTVYLTWSLEL